MNPNRIYFASAQDPTPRVMVVFGATGESFVGRIAQFSRPGDIILRGHESAYERKQSAKWIEIFSRIGKLAPGWNGYGAPKPSQHAIQGAEELVRKMIADDQSPTRVAPSAVGGLGVTRRVGDRMAYIEFYNSGKAFALLTDDAADASDERVIEVSFEKGFTSLLQEMKAFLDG